MLRMTPTFPDVYEGRNSSYINKGCVLTKYTGARGKSGSNDASAEVMAKVISMMEEEGVYWQAGELGAVDAGGGGTIAKLVAHMNVDTVDLGRTHPVHALPLLNCLPSWMCITPTRHLRHFTNKRKALLNFHEIGGKSFFSRTGMI